MSDIVDAIPDELKHRPQWICWKRDEREGTETKLPMRSDREGFAKTNDLTTWSDFETAVKGAREQDWGIGYVFSEDGPYVGVDLDNCRDPNEGKIDDWVEDVLDRLRSYAEVSPSGTGIHIIFKDVDVPGWWKNQKDGDREIEVYDSGQYFTVTGEIIEDMPSECTSPGEFDDWLFREVDAEDVNQGSTTSSPITAVGTDDDRWDLSVYDVISRADHPPDERTTHPVHGSSTGANFMVDNGGETWRCWRHNVTGNAYHLIGMEQNVIRCGDWKHGGLSDQQWAKIFNAGRNMGYDIPDSNDNSKSHQPDGGDADPSKDITLGDLSEGTTLEDPNELSLPSNTSLEDLNGNQIAYYATEYFRTQEFIIALEDTGELYANHNGVWKPNGENVVRRRLRELLGPKYSKHIRREVIDQIKATQSRSRDDMGVPSGTVAVGNGLLDLTDGDIRPLRPDDYALWRMPVTYNEKADCPKFMEFLDDVCPDEYRLLLQEFIGYCLLHDDVPHEKALMLLGPTDAGKSVFLDVVADLYGRENIATQSIQYLVNERWGLAELEGIPVNIRHDLDPAVIKRLGKAKEIISGNQMQAEKKNQDPFTMQPTTKHIFSANRAPDRNTDDEAFWNRWLTVVFPETIPRDDQDSTLTESLTTDAELSGILNWAIKGYQRLTEEGHFTSEPTPAENRERWEQFGSAVEQFLDTQMIQESDAQVPKSVAYEAYKSFASEHGMEVVSQSSFTRELKTKEGIGQSQRRIDGEKTRVYTGVCLNDAALDGSETIQSSSESSTDQASA
jgi:putative DNA primase/helicase